MALHGLSALETIGNPIAHRVGQGIHFALQRFQHEWPVFDFNFSLQFDEPRDITQNGVLRGFRRICCGRKRMKFFRQMSPTFPWRATAMPSVLARHCHYWRIGCLRQRILWAMFGHSLDKTNNSIIVLMAGSTVPKIRMPEGKPRSRPRTIRESRLRVSLLGV